VTKIAPKLGRRTIAGQVEITCTTNSHALYEDEQRENEKQLAGPSLKKLFAT
jgi:hypothetical protein